MTLKSDRRRREEELVLLYQHQAGLGMNGKFQAFVIEGLKELAKHLPTV